jgi:hypothetical protein
MQNGKPGVYFRGSPDKRQRDAAVPAETHRNRAGGSNTVSSFFDQRKGFFSAGRNHLYVAGVDDAKFGQSIAISNFRLVTPHEAGLRPNGLRTLTGTNPEFMRTAVKGTSQYGSA